MDYTHITGSDHAIDENIVFKWGRGRAGPSFAEVLTCAARKNNSDSNNQNVRKL